MRALPCFLCGNKLEERTDKNRKPYFVCDPCGIQLFVRRKAGIEKLHALIEELQGKEIYSHARSPEFLRMLAIFDEISAIKAEIKKIDDEVFLIANDEQAAERRALQGRMKVLLSELEDLADQEDSDQ